MRAISGIAYPLYFNFLPSYLATKFTEDPSLSLKYRNYCIELGVGIVGPLSAAFPGKHLVWPALGDGDVCHCDRHLSFRVRRRQHGRCQFSFRLYHWNASKLW